MGSQTGQYHPLSACPSIIVRGKTKQGINFTVSLARHAESRSVGTCFRISFCLGRRCAAYHTSFAAGSIKGRNSTPQAPQCFKLICMLDDNPHESIQRAGNISERWTPGIPSKYTVSQKRLAEKNSPVSSGLNKSVSTTKRSRRPRRRGSLMHAALCKMIGWLA